MPVGAGYSNARRCQRVNLDLGLDPDPAAEACAMSGARGMYPDKYLQRRVPYVGPGRTTTDTKKAGNP